MIEPVPYIFERLQQNWGDSPRLRLVNAAIADHDGTQDFYFLARASEPDRLPAWYDGLGSLRKDVVLSHRAAIPDIDDRMVTAELPCMTFSTLCRTYAIEKLDLLQIDTEGYDYEILKGVDLGALQPRLVMFEHYHLDRLTFDASLDLMRQNGYECLSDGMDTLCLRVSGLTSRDRRLHRFWRRLSTDYVPDG
jgi:FkbM family methyltransferase